MNKGLAESNLKKIDVALLEVEKRQKVINKELTDKTIPSREEDLAKFKALKRDFPALNKRNRANFSELVRLENEKNVLERTIKNLQERYNYYSRI